MSISIVKGNGNWSEASDLRGLLAGGNVRDRNVDYRTITNEFMGGTGPEVSVFEGDHYLFKNFYKKFEKKPLDFSDPRTNEVEWGVMDVIKTGFSNGQAQMMGSYFLAMYKIGDRTLAFAYDAKTKRSLGYHLPLTNTPRITGQVYNPWAGTWTKVDNSFNTTTQIYMFWVD